MKRFLFPKKVLIKAILFLISLIIGFIVIPPYINNTSGNGSYKVIGISDGDTFKLFDEKKKETLKVRLFGVDCPEKKQDYGTQAKNFSSDLCFGKFVDIRFKKKDGSEREEMHDQYNRLVCEVILPDGKSVNEEILRNGMGWHYKEFSNDPKWATLEEMARAQKVGLWSQRNPVAPWEWRKNKKSNAYGKKQGKSNSNKKNSPLDQGLIYWDDNDGEK